MVGFFSLLCIDSGEAALALPNCISICSRSSKSESVKRSSLKSSYSLGFQDNCFWNAASFFLCREALDLAELFTDECCDTTSFTTVGFFRIDFLVTSVFCLPLVLTSGLGDSISSSPNLVSFLISGLNFDSGLVFCFSNFFMLSELGFNTWVPMRVISDIGKGSSNSLLLLWKLETLIWPDCCFRGLALGISRKSTFSFGFSVC